MTNESFDSSDPTLSRVFIGWLKEKFKLLNLNNKAKLEIGMQIAALRFFFKETGGKCNLSIVWALSVYVALYF
ncbi:hypothetical protein ACT4X1_01270 [Acinetobacter baumannii]